MGSDDQFHKNKERSAAALQRKRHFRARNKRFLIVCEGTKTEPHYLRDLLVDLRIHTSLVQIEPNDGVSPDRIVGHALKLYKEDATSGDAFDTVYCVFDRDTHTTFADAVQRTNDLYAQGTPLVAITSDPCFEFWLLLHFAYTDQPFHAAGKNSVADQVVKVLKKKPGLSNYAKGKTAIYALLKPKLDDALRHAERLRKHNKETNSSSPATDVDRLIKAIQTLKAL
jgi:RloB-like protein